MKVEKKICDSNVIGECLCEVFEDGNWKLSVLHY